MSYISSTDSDRQKMLKKVGVANIEEILDDIPTHLRLDRPLDIAPLSEMEVLTEIEKLSHDNLEGALCFAGGGVYDHFIPSAVGAIVSRPEFMTAYTPYQAEVSQGTLQAIYEFQTHICRLTGMDVANASMYDGATAAAEAVLLCVNKTRRDKVLLCETLSPLVRQVIATYTIPRNIELVLVPATGGVTDPGRVTDLADDQTAGIVIGQPNFFGSLEDVEPIAEAIHTVGGKLIMAVDPMAQALLKTPGDIGADLVVGEGQPLGLSMSFGGPLLGFFAAGKDLVRSLPGRIVARTKDAAGKTGFVLTLQTREQHIRRQKATSNICTNQALCATTATVYMSLMGKTGLKRVALLSAQKAQKAARLIAELNGFEIYFPAPFVREFVIKTPRPAAEVITAMLDQGILPGVDAGRWYPDMKDGLIVALTEKRTDDQIAVLVNGLKELSTSGVLSGMQS